MPMPRIVNFHHQLPISNIYGTGEISSSDAQRFRLRADSLIASYYPRYYGYYDKAIGIYTHVSDQYSVFNTKVISCSPREALYVLDGLLENNTILKPKDHTTDTHGERGNHVRFMPSFGILFYAANPGPQTTTTL